MIYLHKGDRNDNGTIQIVDEDRLCFLVLSTNKSTRGLRTISKQLLEEFVQWESQNPDGKATDARDDLSGKSEIDKFEYGYNATLYALAKLNREIADGRTLNAKPLESPAQLQQIFYGAPGTGKSHSVKTETKAWEERGRVVRTTFHPDSDYSTFVGAYKPTTESVQRYDIYNKPMTRDGVPVMEQIITYEFVGQAFLQAYIDAWKNREEPEFLIIEEINRGNCAQIFGDLFQLLDRGDDGYSEYAIKADKDLQKHLSKAFKEVEIEDFPNVKAGKELLLPNNLYIRATMNTSDQSLFPIDSAFKRRWDWKYRPISNAQLGWKIEADGMLYDWWEFLERINREIGTTTNSEDKKLGYFFCKPPKDSDTITEDKFVGKVLFYLWNDVFKDGDISLFKVSDEPEAEICFDTFYGSDNKVNSEAIRTFLVSVVGEENIKTNDDAPKAVDEDENGNAIDYTKYSFDGKSRLSKKDLGYNIVMKYINEHSDKTFAELQSDLAFDDTVDNKYRYKGVLARAEEITGSYTPCFGVEQKSSDGVKYKVLTWWNKYNINFIIKFAKAQGWAVNTVTE